MIVPDHRQSKPSGCIGSVRKKALYGVDTSFEFFETAAIVESAFLRRWLREVRAGVE